jgi:hypothetical protein
MPRSAHTGGDVAAHHAGAHHMHVARREVAVLAEGLQALLQVEDAHQVARGGRGEDGVERGRVAGRHRERVAAVVFPDVDDGVGRRVVGALTLRAAWARALSATMLAQRAAQQALLQRQLARRLAAEHHDARGDSMTRAGTQSSARPRRFAFFASTLLPVSIRSSAAAGPISAAGAACRPSRGRCRA